MSLMFIPNREVLEEFIQANLGKTPIQFAGEMEFPGAIFVAGVGSAQEDVEAFYIFPIPLEDLVIANNHVARYLLKLTGPESEDKMWQAIMPENVQN